MTQREVTEAMGGEHVFCELWHGAPMELIQILERLFNFFPQTKGLRVRMQSMPERAGSPSAITFYFPIKTTDSKDGDSNG